MQLPRCIVIDFPKRLALTLASVHLTAAGIVLVVDILPWLARILISFAIVLLLVASWQRLADQEGVRLTLTREGVLTIDDAQARLLSHALAWSWLVVLPFVVDERRRTLLVTSDMLADEDWRCLQAWLRWRANFNPVDDAPDSSLA